MPTRRLCAAAAVLLACGCEEKPDPPAPPTRDRSNAVAAFDGGSAPPPSVKPAASASPASAPRQLCVGQTPRPAPKGSLQVQSAPGAAPLPATIAFGTGKWIWVNLWAAWCGPCKEEMPRLSSWQARLRSAGVMIDVAFVSLDDDERQLARFLEAQPAGGVRASYWLPEGSARSSWLAQLGVKDPPELPVQALVDPAGRITCIVQGAVEDGDYASIAAFVGARHR